MQGSGEGDLRRLLREVLAISIVGVVIFVIVTRALALPRSCAAAAHSQHHGQGERAGAAGSTGTRAHAPAGRGARLSAPLAATAAGNRAASFPLLSRAPVTGDVTSSAMAAFACRRRTRAWCCIKATTALRLRRASRSPLTEAG
jgi:hypothetical protein